MTAPHDLSVVEAGAAIRAGRLTAAALTRAALERIAAHDAEFHAFVAIRNEQAVGDARAADAELSGGYDRGPLHGIPYALKDLCDVGGEPTSCNSHVRRGHLASVDSRVVSRMRAAGAILLGKLNLHEFGTGGTGAGLPCPPARNPWNPARLTGGSSSGAGVAIGARYVRVTIGTDSGGSIRLPGAYCGGVGLKPTFGRVSRRGLAPLSASLDHIGPLTRTVEEAALVMQVIAGHDAADPASADIAVSDFGARLRGGVKGVRIGIPSDHFGLAGSFDPSVAEALTTAAQSLEDAGATLTDIALPPLGDFRAAGMAIMLAEAFAVHRADLAGRMADYSPETAERFLLGAGITGSDIARAREVAVHLGRQVDDALSGCDVILTATTVGGAGALGSTGGMMATPRRIPLLPFNLTGHPAIHVPTGLDSDGMPVGVQLVGAKFREATLLRIAWTVENASGWHAVPFPAIVRTEAVPPSPPTGRQDAV